MTADRSVETRSTRPGIRLLHPCPPRLSLPSSLRPADSRYSRRMERDTAVIDTDETTGTTTATEELVEAELLVEEVSIDGMCGVY